MSLLEMSILSSAHFLFNFGHVTPIHTIEDFGSFWIFQFKKIVLLLPISVPPAEANSPIKTSIIFHEFLDLIKHY